MKLGCFFIIIIFVSASLYGKDITSMHIRVTKYLPHFLGYKTDFFSFQNNPKDLDPSYKTDLDLGDCLGRVKLVL